MLKSLVKNLVIKPGHFNLRASHLSRTMEGLATRDDAKEAVDSIVATEIRVGTAEENRGQSLKLKVCTSEFGCFWNVLAG